MASRPVRPSTPSDSTSDSAVSSTSVDIAAPVTATSSSVDASETQTTSTPTLAATPAATSSPSEAQATFLYPVGSPTFNSIDAVDFSYQSSWTAANLTVFCTVNPGSGTLTSYEIDQSESDATVDITYADFFQSSSLWRYLSAQTYSRQLECATVSCSVPYDVDGCKGWFTCG